jgi:hypothetical protein
VIDWLRKGKLGTAHPKPGSRYPQAEWR